MIKSIKITLVILVGFCMIVHAQNMIPNNGFESFTSAPTGPGQWYYIPGWNNVNKKAVFLWPYASPDFLSTSGLGQVSLPNSVFANVNPYAGNSIMGFAAYISPGVPDFREYISCRLSAPFTIGETYTVSFMLSNGMSNHYGGSGCDHIGVHFSINPLTQLQHEPINVVPQCEIASVYWDTSWKQITFNYTATDTFRYFTIGNFYNDANTTQSLFNPLATNPSTAYYFIDEVVVAHTIPLPMELISFEGEGMKYFNRLHWTTASEFNNDYFNIERSVDGKRFETIGTVDGHGISIQLLNYSFDDLHPHIGINYYRLKQTDYNGLCAFSDIIAVRSVNRDAPCIVYVSDGHLILNCSHSEDMKVQLCSLDGKVIKTVTFSGYSEHKIFIHDVGNGLYILRITEGENIQNYKLIKI